MTSSREQYPLSIYAANVAKAVVADLTPAVCDTHSLSPHRFLTKLWRSP
jgi:hypothetical protein